MKYLKLIDKPIVVQSDIEQINLSKHLIKKQQMKQAVFD